MSRALAVAAAAWRLLGLLWPILSALLAVYLLSCVAWPLRRCGLCSGVGRHYRSDGQVLRLCWWCKGSGRRRRYATRAWGRLRKRTE